MDLTPRRRQGCTRKGAQGVVATETRVPPPPHIDARPLRPLSSVRHRPRRLKPTEYIARGRRHYPAERRSVGKGEKVNRLISLSGGSPCPNRVLSA